MRSVIEMPKKLKTFQKDERGAIAIIFGLALVPVIFFSGVAIDYGRATHAKTLLQGAADAAVTAASNSNGTTADKMQIAANIFAANAGVAQQRAPTLTTDGNGVSSFKSNTRWGEATTTISITNTGITVQPTVQVPTTFMRIAYVPTLTAKADAKAVGQSKKLEVAMMIDLTGSMGWNDRATTNPQPKIKGLKTAAADFLNILFPNGATTSATTRVAIVPFADYVNAGEFAAAVTGLPQNGTSANGGLYSKVNNLSKTKQGNFTGTYAGTFASMTPSQLSTSGGQCGAQSPYQNSGVSAPTNTAGTSYVSSFTTQCAAGGAPTNVGLKKDSSDRPYGVRVDLEDSPSLTNYPYLKKGSEQTYRKFQIKVSNSSKWDEDDTSDNDAFVKVPTSATGLTLQPSRTANHDGNSKTGPVGVEVTCKDNDCPSSPPSDSVITKITSGGYWALTKLDKNDSSISKSWSWKSASTSNPRFYVPLYTSYTTAGTTDPECSAAVDQPNGQLISCVTERQGSEAYTNVAPASSKWIGAYNAGSSTKENYSSDGKCMVAGRELPKVIPLTSDKATLTNFFDTCSVGGATPGHIGTAWAWYMISPEWSSIFPTASAPAAYNDDQTIKAVVLMTDGEYNVHYASAAAKDQALALCTAMKAKGVRVYTIGFGFAPTATQRHDFGEECA